jgi:hypothetical protein
MNCLGFQAKDYGNKSSPIWISPPTPSRRGPLLPINQDLFTCRRAPILNPDIRIASSDKVTPPENLGTANLLRSRTLVVFQT